MSCRFTARKGTVAFQDAAGVGPTAGPGPGDLTIGDTNGENAEIIRVLDRGVFDCLLEGDDLEQEWSITIGLVAQSLTHATLARILDFLRGGRGRSGSTLGTYAGTTLQTVADNPDIWAFKVIWTGDAGGAVGSITLPMCIASYSFAEAKEGNTLTITGRNNGAPVLA